MAATVFRSSSTVSFTARSTSDSGRSCCTLAMSAGRIHGLPLSESSKYFFRNFSRLLSSERSESLLTDTTMGGLYLGLDRLRFSSSVCLRLAAT